LVESEAGHLPGVPETSETWQFCRAAFSLRGFLRATCATKRIWIIVKGKMGTRNEPARRSGTPALRIVRGAADSDLPDARGDDLSVETLYERYAAYVAAVASRILGRAAEVEDVVQDVFASAVSGLRRRDSALETKGWLAKVTVRRCVRQLRARRLWAMVDLAADPSYDRLADPGAGPEERQLVVEVYRALDRVPARERVAWALRHVEGERLEQVAALCGCSLATAKRRISAAHVKIRRRLGERCHG
jgi:RNA polymerase sigma-70 factor, ECF subfamily